MEADLLETGRRDNLIAHTPIDSISNYDVLSHRRVFS
jgi:hypothetical protein